MKLSLIIFTLDEIDGMKVIMPRIKKEWYDQLIIVDGGSTDGTFEYAKENDYFIFAQNDKGPGAAFREAVEKANGDIIITFSPDGNSIPEKIPDLVDKMKEGYDMVIASRYLNGAKSYDDDAITAFGNRVFTRLINLLFGTGVTDSLVMYRAFKRDLVNSLKIDAKGVSWSTQLLLRASRKRLRITEIPADEPPRIGGTRKMRPLRNGLWELSMIIKEFFIRRY